MKVQVTEKAIKAAYPVILSVTYCGMESLLARMDPEYYTAGYDGWKSDIYKMPAPFTNVCVSTGYQPINGIKPDYDLMKKYDRAAFGKDNDERRALLVSFLNEILSA